MAGSIDTSATGTQPPQPIKKLAIRDERFPKGDYSHLSVEVNLQGDLILEGYDGNNWLKEMTGDWDYEFSWTVPGEWKDTVLLHLIKDRFPKESDFHQWCKERSIPTKFWFF